MLASPAVRMKAIVQTGYGSPDALELGEVPAPVVTDDTVLVRVRAASINALDVHLLRRVAHVFSTLFGRRPSPIRGVDLAGVVEACGRNVSRFKPGDEVFGVGRGSFAELAIAREIHLAPKPCTSAFEPAAALPLAGMTAMQGLRDKARIQPGQRVLIYGAGGGTGTLAIQIAKALDAHVTAVTRTEHLDLLRAIGADEVVDYTREDFTRRGDRCDVLVDIGANRSSADYDRALAAGGKLVRIGAPKNAGALVASLLDSMIHPRHMSLMARARHEDLIALKDLVEAGKLTPVIGRVYPLREVPEAFRCFATGRVAGKIVISIP